MNLGVKDAGQRQKKRSMHSILQGCTQRERERENPAIRMLIHFNACSLSCTRSGGDLHGGEGGGEPVRGEERAVRRNEQPREVVRNGRYAQQFHFF